MKNLCIENVLWHSNQFSYTDQEKSVFQSYNSICAIIDYKKQAITLGSDWSYSKTTRKHLYAFFADHGLFDLCNIDAMRDAIKNKKIWDFTLDVDYTL